MSVESRKERSLRRAEAFNRRRRYRMITLVVTTILYFGVPLLWDFSVEFGWVRQIQLKSLLDMLESVHMVMLMVILILVPEAYKVVTKDQGLGYRVTKPSTSTQQLKTTE